MNSTTKRDKTLRGSIWVKRDLTSSEAGLGQLYGLVARRPADLAQPYELHDSIEQPARSRAQSGRFLAKLSRPG